MAQLEIRTNPDALLGEPLATGLRGAGVPAQVPHGAKGEAVRATVRSEATSAAHWKARLIDDDSRLWRCSAPTAAGLGNAWKPAKESSGAAAALRSLRPLEIEVRAELPDGRSATRTVKRRLLAEGTKVRNWNKLSPLHTSLYLPAEELATAALIIDATELTDASLVAPTAALLASHGAAVVTAQAQRSTSAVSKDAVDALAELLTALPAARDCGAPTVISPPSAPPGFPCLTPGDPDIWAALLRRCQVA